MLHFYKSVFHLTETSRGFSTPGGSLPGKDATFHTLLLALEPELEERLCGHCLLVRNGMGQKGQTSAQIVLQIV